MSFLERGILRAKGGVVKIGADVEIKRGAADRLDVEDALQVSGTANITGAVKFGAGITQTGGANSFGGTTTITNKIVIPYATVAAGGTATALATNGQVAVTQKADRTYLTFQSGGTPFYIKLPQVSNGTMLVAVGGTIGDT